MSVFELRCVGCGAPFTSSGPRTAVCDSCIAGDHWAQLPRDAFRDATRADLDMVMLRYAVAAE